MCLCLKLQGNHKTFMVGSFSQNLVLTENTNNTELWWKFWVFVTSSHMVCDISILHIGYISATDHLSVFVHTERLDKMKL